MWNALYELCGLVENVCVCVFVFFPPSTSRYLNMHSGHHCHLQASADTAERHSPHSAALSACWCIGAVIQVSLSSVAPDSDVMHIKSLPRRQPGFSKSYPPRTLASAPAPPDGRALHGAEAVASQVQLYTVYWCRTPHTLGKTPTLRPQPC